MTASEQKSCLRIRSAASSDCAKGERRLSSIRMIASSQSFDALRQIVHQRWACALSCWTVLVCAMLASCQTSSVISSDGRPLPPAPKSVAAAPASAQVERMVFMVGGKPEDTDRNGYPDLIRATVGLFSRSYPMALRQEGDFVFELYPRGLALDPETSPLMTWHITADEVERSFAEARWGPSYHFRLSLLDRGPRGDEYELTAADLRATFIPSDGGRPIRNDGVRSIQIGRR